MNQRFNLIRMFNGHENHSNNDIESTMFDEERTDEQIVVD